MISLTSPPTRQLRKLATRLIFRLRLYCTAPMSRQGAHDRKARARRKQVRPLLSPVTLISVAVLIAYLATYSSLTDLPRRYRLAMATVPENGRQDLEEEEKSALSELEGTLPHRDSNNSERTVADLIRTDDHQKDKDNRTRHERDVQRRKEKFETVHEAVALRRKQQQQQQAASPVEAEDTSEQKPPQPSKTISDPSTVQKASEPVPSGARTSGKVAEFRGSNGGTEDGMIRGQNVTRVSYTVYKILKLFGFTSMTDSPAGAHAEWMSDMVRRLTYDVPSFRYVGVDSDSGGLERARLAMGSVVDGEWRQLNVEEELPGATDVVLHWTELDGGERDARTRGYVSHVARVLRTAKRGGHGYIVFGQYPRLNGPSPMFRGGKWRFGDDEREEPFLFNEHVRGVVPTGSGGKAYMMYLTFYSLRSIPMTTLEAL